MSNNKTAATKRHKDKTQTQRVVKQRRICRSSRGEERERERGSRVNKKVINNNLVKLLRSRVLSLLRFSCLLWMKLIVKQLRGEQRCYTGYVEVAYTLDGDSDCVLLVYIHMICLFSIPYSFLYYCKIYFLGYLKVTSLF